MLGVHTLFSSNAFLMNTLSLRQLFKDTHHSEPENKRRRLTLYFISYIGVFIMLMLALKNINRGNELLVVLLLVFAALMFTNVVLLHLYKGREIFYYIAGVIVLFMVVATIYSGGYRNTGLYFIFPLIFIQIVIVGYKAAIAYVSITMSIVVYMLYHQEDIPATYDPEYISRFIISAFSFICVAFIGEYFWHKSHRELLTDNMEKYRQANTDPLTKLPNRRFLESVFFDQAMTTPSNYFPLSLVVVDIDYFKVINDTYGHNAGDQVLIHITKIMKKNTRATDLVVRTGGEEFLIIYPNTPLAMAKKLAEKIRVEVAASPYQDGDINHPITASFGVASASTDANIQTALQLADNHLYDAKNSGRNCVI